MSRYKRIVNACDVCGKDVLSSRSDAKFCSANCRKADSRKKEKVDKKIRQLLALIAEIQRLGGGEKLLEVLDK